VPQLRQNIITGEWVVFAPERAKRPTDYISVSAERTQKKEDCPFCIDSKKSEYEKRIKEHDGPYTYVITNKYPAFVEDQSRCVAASYKVEDDFYKMRLSLGGHDVVVIKNHDLDLPDFSNAVWEDMFRAFKERYQYFKTLCNVEYVMPIYNHGPQAAASIEHPHAQIFASTIIPNIIFRELSHTANYYTDHHECAFCAMIDHERDQNVRTLFENEDFIAFNFYAARFPFEAWILPKRHMSQFVDLKPKEMENLSAICRQVFKRLDEVLNDPPVNFFLHSAPTDSMGRNLSYYHWHLEVAPRLSLYGGFELGSGVTIDIIAPEQAAEYLRLGRTTRARKS